MGYTTEFSGQVTIEPPLNEAEIEYLNQFAYTRRMKRTKGSYFVDGSGYAGQGNDPDILDYNYPPLDQPGLWCQWVPTEDGTAIEWNGAEKFYDATEWMAYLINNFLKQDAEASKSKDPQFKDFTFDHVLNGKILARGEDFNDIWKLKVKDNKVKRKDIKL